jgi:hypothetical protein
LGEVDREKDAGAMGSRKTKEKRVNSSTLKAHIRSGGLQLKMFMTTVF